MSLHEPPAIPPEPNASDQPHDVLAAEEFAMPAPEAARHTGGPMQLPGDPTGISEPHDILAAEQFAMPAPPRRVPFAAPTAPARAHAGRAGLIAAGLGVLALLRRRRGARR